MENASIIIVDDNPNNLQVLGKTLKKENYHVEFATDGKTALEWINNQDFDLILLDIMMPEMDGYEVCRIIRTDKKYDNIPVIFLTAETSKESVLKGFEIGAQDFVTKPFDSRELLARVRTHLEIKYSREQLQTLNKHLEDKVKERTLQLQQAHDELKEAHSRLSDLDKAKTEFLRLISHEIRTPLNGILGPVQLIKDRIGSDDIGALLEILDISVSRLEKFSYDALLITRLRAQKDKISKTRLSLNKVIHASLDELSEKLNEKQIQPDLRMIPDEVYMEGDFELLKTCFINILKNAIMFTPDNGTIKITINQKGGETLCEISDQGPGFPENMLTKPFELFSLNEPNIDSKLGLGLYLSKLIMDAHSGVIEAGNTEEGGAMIKLSFND
jgi:two-component system sensor histidine kinase/response regulator